MKQITGHRNNTQHQHQHQKKKSNTITFLEYIHISNRGRRAKKKYKRTTLCVDHALSHTQRAQHSLRREEIAFL